MGEACELQFDGDWCISKLAIRQITFLLMQMMQ